MIYIYIQLVWRILLKRDFGESNFDDKKEFKEIYKTLFLCPFLEFNSKNPECFKTSRSYVSKITSESRFFFFFILYNFFFFLKKALIKPFPVKCHSKEDIIMFGKLFYWKNLQNIRIFFFCLILRFFFSLPCQT